MQKLFDSGDSWLIFGLILGVSAILLFIFLCKGKGNIVGDWTFEPIIEVSKKRQQHPFVQTWFNWTRGYHYVNRIDVNESKKTLLETVKDTLKGPTKSAKVEMGSLLTGWAFAHALQHFLIAFLCPKLAYVSFLYGILWEILESANASHDVLDIFWNMCGCVLGLIIRMAFFQ